MYFYIVFDYKFLSQIYKYSISSMVPRPVARTAKKLGTEAMTNLEFCLSVQRSTDEKIKFKFHYPC